MISNIPTTTWTPGIEVVVGRNAIPSSFTFSYVPIANTSVLASAATTHNILKLFDGTARILMRDLRESSAVSMALLKFPDELLLYLILECYSAVHRTNLGIFQNVSLKFFVRRKNMWKVWGGLDAKY